MICEKDAFLLRKSVGAAGKDGEWELSLGMDGTMMVKSERTGRTFVMQWQQVLRLAIEAGTDKEPGC